MSFRFYTNMMSQASRNFAWGLFVTGLVLIGFGFLVFVLRDLFAFLAAALFIFAGVGCGITAVRIYFAQRRINRAMKTPGDEYRENVRIHIDDHFGP
jgi:hypothetical protein